MPDRRLRLWLEIAAASALGAILSLIKVYSLPQGGSVTATMLPILFLALWRGPRAGALAGLLLGGLKLALGPFIVHPVQVLFDYPIPYALLGVAGFFQRFPALGTLVASLLRLGSHTFSGAVFFASFAPPGANHWAYSLAYNAGYILPEVILCSVLVPILLRRVAGQLSAD